MHMNPENTGDRLWNQAKTVIPGGNQLLSKRPERFLPGLWPAYYSKAKGCTVWDTQGREYLDFAQMGVGTCALGYADDDVDDAVVRAIRDGSMSSLNCPEEVALAERLVALHPWSDMVRFSRTGGEACALAVRVARAATGRDTVAFCGYHGWHDWYLAANLADQTHLDGQLLPGLAPRGVPRGLAGTALPFSYNRVDQLRAIFAENPGQIAAVIMEPQRGTEPQEGFLAQVRQLCTQEGAVLIFDEVTSGFRMNLGGIHLLYGVDPDIAVLGKALGNGYPISAVVGRREVMNAAQDTFISSTFWTERVGFTAALATLDKMERCNVQAHLVRQGERLAQGLERAAREAGLGLHISGIAPLLHLSFQEGGLETQTLYAQEMLARGYLVGTAIYTTYAYTDAVVDRFLRDTGEAFALLAQALRTGTVAERITGGVIQMGFKRLT